MKLDKDALDLGVVVSDGQVALGFYRDVLGLEHVGDMPMPGGGTMHRLSVGSSVLKLVHRDEPATRPDGPGAFNGTLGPRYFTFTVADIAETVAACEAAGRAVVWPVRELRKGIWIAMVEDPDGNWVEFLSTTAPSDGAAQG